MTLPTPWPKGRKAVVSLTYDDGISTHPGEVAPLLETYGLRGTFYAPLQSDINNNPLAWRKLAERGHEIGNHTVYHPCWNVKGKYDSWLPESLNLVNYDEDHWMDEITAANEGLFLIDGRTRRTFGNTCFDNYMGPERDPICLEPLIARAFEAARGEETRKPVNLDSINYYNLGTIWADRRDFADFVPELQSLLDSGGWIIYTFHGVGEGRHTHYIAESEHRRLLAFLRDNSSVIWTAPVIEVVEHLKK